MTTTNPLLHPATPVGDIASRIPGATAIFQAHSIDFCCGGKLSLQEACRRKALDAQAILARLEALGPKEEGFEDWTVEPLPGLIAFVLKRFHETSRAEFPRLLAMAHKVEAVHADKETCPRGLSELLDRMHAEYSMHMEKEEQILFPMILAGRGRQAVMPVQVMEMEHQDLARDLQAMHALTKDLVPPEDACTTWRSLYLDLKALEDDLKLHMHLENNVLFPRALAEQV